MCYISDIMEEKADLLQFIANDACYLFQSLVCSLHMFHRIEKSANELILTYRERIVAKLHIERVDMGLALRKVI